jgi:iron complex transport system ATP-binding protein
VIAGRELTVPRRLAGVSLSIAPGEVVGVIGPSGAGKSTLLSVLAGDLEPSAGRVCLDERPLTAYRPDDLARRRAVLPQSSALAFHFRVDEVVRMGRTPWGDESPAAVRRALADVGMSGLAERDYLTLSGGERQRVHLARVLCQLDGAERPFLLCDEPTAHLDVGHVRGVLSILRAIAARGAGVLIVLHDLQAALDFTDRLALIAHGRLHGFGPPAHVLASPACAEAFDCPIQVLDLKGRPVVAAG